MDNPTLQAESPSRLAQAEKWVPGLRAARSYRRAWLPRDLMAGLVLCTLLVPQGMAYAELAGLPPITGLYTTVVCLVAYAAVGPSPILVLGPDSSLGPMIAAAILPLAAGDVNQAIALADLDLELNAGGIHLVFAELKDPVQDKIVRYGLLETIDHRHFYPTVEVAVEAFFREGKSDNSNQIED